MITVLSPESDPRVDTPSFTLRVERGRFSALFMGDATDDALGDLLLHPEGLRSRVYVPPHQRDASQLHHVAVDGLAEWIAWWDAQQARVTSVCYDRPRNIARKRTSPLP